jgi:hypothetical protein
MDDERELSGIHHSRWPTPIEAIANDPIDRLPN